MKNARFENETKKFGIVLDSINFESSQNFLSNIEKKSNENEFFLVFSGYENNFLFNSSNFDGLILWNYSEQSEMRSANLDIPLVSIGEKISDKPCVSFDEKLGMEAFVSHFSKFHKVKKFILFDLNAGLRSQILKSILKKNEISFTEIKKIEELNKINNIVEKDSVLITSNDFSAFSAIAYFSNNNLLIPVASLDYKSSELRISKIIFPKIEAFNEALNLLKNLFNKKETSDKTISTLPFFSKSCGCSLPVSFNSDFRIESILDNLKSELNQSYDKKDFVETLKNQLSGFGFNNISIVICENGLSKYFGGFMLDSKVENLRFEEKLFESKYLLPEDYKYDLENGNFIVLPLFLKNQYSGYVIANICSFSGSVYERLGKIINESLSNFFVLQELNEAKLMAQKVKFEKTEFFANVGSELCDPLKDLSAKVSQIEHNVNEGLLDADILGEQLIFLKSQIEAHLTKSEMLVDLARSQVDNLPMDKKLFDIHQILPVNIAASIEKSIPLLFGDVERLKKALTAIFECISSSPIVSVKIDGIHIEFNSLKNEWKKPELVLAKKVIMLQDGEIIHNETNSEIVFYWPNFEGTSSIRISKNKNLLSLSNSQSKLFNIPVNQVTKENIDDLDCFILTWNPDDAPIDEWVKAYGLRRNEKFFKAPLICYSQNLIGHSFIEMLEQKVKTQKTNSILFVGAEQTRYETWATDSNSVSISSIEEFEQILNEIVPSLIVFEHPTKNDIEKVRENPKTVQTPIIIAPEEILSEDELNVICSFSKIILCNRGVADSEQFNERIQGILAGDEILPQNTGALVKKIIFYLNQNASKQIVRWQLAESINVSEDYLTRIFHKELGLSLWEYLNRFRIHIATKMLLETNDSIFEISEKSGFQDQAYFCRVFKKIYGFPPGKLRNKK